MKYYLRNIAQKSPLRASVLFVLGGLAWLATLLGGGNMTQVLVTMCMTIVNTILFAQFFYKSGETNMPSGFMASTYWFGMSALPVLHDCWQLQLVLLGVWISGLIWCGIRHQDTPTEETFLITLICCFLAPMQVIAISGILSLWINLLLKGYMTLRVWCASLIGIALYALVMLVLHYMGWMPWLWMENIPRLSWQLWLISLAVLIALFTATMLPLRKPSVASGVVYLFLMLMATGYGIWSILLV